MGRVFKHRENIPQPPFAYVNASARTRHEYCGRSCCRSAPASFPSPLVIEDTSPRPIRLLSPALTTLQAPRLQVSVGWLRLANSTKGGRGGGLFSRVGSSTQKNRNKKRSRERHAGKRREQLKGQWSCHSPFRWGREAAKGNSRATEAGRVREQPQNARAATRSMALGGAFVAETFRWARACLCLRVSLRNFRFKCPVSIFRGVRLLFDSAK